MDSEGRRASMGNPRERAIRASVFVSFWRDSRVLRRFFLLVEGGPRWLRMRASNWDSL